MYTQYEHLHTYVHTTHTHTPTRYTRKHMECICCKNWLSAHGHGSPRVCSLQAGAQESLHCDFSLRVWVKGWKKPNSQRNDGQERAPAHSVLLLCAGLPLVPAGGPPTRSRAICSAQFTDQLFTSSTSTSQTHVGQSLTKCLGTPWPSQIHKENEPSFHISIYRYWYRDRHRHGFVWTERKREREACAKTLAFQRRLCYWPALKKVEIHEPFRVIDPQLHTKYLFRLIHRNSNRKNNFNQYISTIQQLKNV